MPAFRCHAGAVSVELGQCSAKTVRCDARSAELRGELMKCPRCGKRLSRKENETDEEFRRRWETDMCDGDGDE